MCRNWLLPLAEADQQPHILVGHVDPASVGVLPVHTENLPVVPVVEVEAVDVLVDRVEDADLNAVLPHLLDGLPPHPGNVSEVIEDDLDLHAVPDPVGEDGQHPIPQLPLRQDEILQEDEPLRLLHPGERILKEVRARGEVDGGGVPVEQKAPPGQQPGGPLPVGEQLSQLLLDVVGPPPVQRAVLGRGNGNQVQSLALDVTAPEDVENHPPHRQGHHQQRPGQFIAAAGGTGLDIDGHADGNELQDRKDDEGMGLEEVGQHHHGDNIQKQQEQDHCKAQGGGDAALSGLLDVTLFHGTLLSRSFFLKEKGAKRTLTRALTLCNSRISAR